MNRFRGVVNYGKTEYHSVKDCLKGDYILRNSNEEDVMRSKNPYDFEKIVFGR